MSFHTSNPLISLMSGSRRTGDTKSGSASTGPNRYSLACHEKRRATGMGLARESTKRMLQGGSAR
jgi:hypothetical protein